MSTPGQQKQSLGESLGKVEAASLKMYGNVELVNGMT